MKDLAGNELEPDMKVLICVPGYKHLVPATIQSISPKMVICSYVPHWKSTEESVSRYPNQVVVPMVPGYGPPATAGSHDFPDEDFPEWTFQH